MKAYNLSKKKRLYHKAVKKAEEQQNQGFYERAALAWLEAAILLPQDEGYEDIVSCLDKAKLAANSNSSYLKTELAGVLTNLGTIFYEKCELDKAESYFQQALTVNEKLLDKSHPDIATILKNLGNVYYEKTEFDKAEDCFQRALTITEKISKKDNTDIASILNNLGCVYYEKGELDKAELYFQHALIIRKRTLGKENKSSGNSLDYIEEINRLTQENIENRTALFQANRLAYLGKMASMMVHNMNCPIDTIQTTALTALNNEQKPFFNTDTELQPLLKDIVEQTEKLNIIVNNFKNFISGDRTLLTEIKLNTIIDEIYQLFFDTAYRFDNIQLIKNFTEPSPVAYANEFSLQEILISVLSSVREILKNKPMKTVRISTWQEDDKVGFTVEESIDGVDEKEQTPSKSFTSLSASKNENMGLGLYFCKAICSSLGGDISHYSIPKGGTAFRISLMSERKII